MKHFSNPNDWKQQCFMLQNIVLANRKVVGINSCDQKNEIRTHHWGLHDYLLRNDGIRGFHPDVHMVGTCLFSIICQAKSSSEESYV